jgi:hypothetical protein
MAAAIPRAVATPQRVAEHLHPFTPLIPITGLTWQALQRALADQPDVIGEVRSPADWDAAPVGRLLHAMAIRLPNGLAIRWASGDFDEAGKSYGHVGLVRPTDPPIEFRRGYVTVRPDEIVVEQ